MPQQYSARQTGGPHRRITFSLLCFSTLSVFSPLSASCEPGDSNVVKASEAVTKPAAVPIAVSAAAPDVPGSASGNEPDSRLDTSGDLRLRYEGNYSDAAPTRNRAVIRGRIRAAYRLNDWLTIGGRIGTGNPDDPNSDDVTLSNFADDLDVSLDTIYAAATLGDLTLHGGKIPLPFKRTDLVWDGDVNPQGVSLNYTPLIGGGHVDLAALYFVIDESGAGPDSIMKGVQLGLHAREKSIVAFDAAAAYYDYTLNSLAGADAGDFRSNLLALDGGYLSDFDLLDIVGGVTYSGFGSHWPLRLSADFVRNLGSATNEDTGYGVNLSAGRTEQEGDWRFVYGYMQAEVDAVFAAFSHDNLALATNYEQHALTLDYVIDEHLVLNATYYKYRSLESTSLALLEHGDWLNRLRLNAVIIF